MRRDSQHHITGTALYVVYLAYQTNRMACWEYRSRRVYRITRNCFTNLLVTEVKDDFFIFQTELKWHVVALYQDSFIYLSDNNLKLYR
jgi:hypothetical protein